MFVVCHSVCKCFGVCCDCEIVLAVFVVVADLFTMCLSVWSVIVCGFIVVPLRV